MHFRKVVASLAVIQILELLILGTKASILETVHLESYETITGMFLDCDLYILSPKVQIENMARISKPVMLYNDYETYISDYFHHPNSGRPIGPPAPPGGTETVSSFFKSWRVATRRPCKAELVVHWTRENFEKPTERLRDLFALEQDLDSAFVYHVLIHRGSSTLPKRLFLWDKPEGGASFRRTLAAKVRGPFRTEYLATMYQVTYAMDPEVDQDLKILQHPLQRYILDEFLALCLRCTMDDVMIDGAGGGTVSLEQVASNAILRGSITAHTLQFSKVISSAYVVIDSIAAENYQTKVMVVGPLSRSRDPSRLHSFGREVLTNRNVVVHPEEIMVYFILQKHINATIVEAMERGNIHVPEYVFEAITAIGQSSGQQGGSFFITQEISLVFLTCSNVTQIIKALVFTQPYDTASWYTWFVTSAVVCFILYITIDSNRSIFNAVSSIVLMIFRILIENFHDLSRLIKKKPTVFAMLTAFIALCAITLTNGYRGVLTSDLVVTPIVQGPASFDGLIREKWRIFPNYNSRLLEKQETEGNLDKKTRSQILYGRMLPVLIQLFYNDLATENYYQSRGNKTRSFKDEQLKKIYESVYNGYIASTRNPNIGNAVLDTCSCNQTAYVTFNHPSAASGLPRSCKRSLLQGQAFVVSQETVLKIVKSWSSVFVRSGPVFQSFVRLLESGTYKWLEGHFRYEDSSITVRNNVIEVVDRQTVAPLTLNSVIVVSSFSIWWKLLKYGCLVFIIECIIALIRVTFSFETVQ